MLKLCKIKSGEKLLKTCLVAINQYNYRKMGSDHLKQIYLSAITAVDPSTLIKQTMKRNNNQLFIEKKCYELQKPCYVVGFGKAVLAMAIEVEKILESYLKEGIINVPVGICENFKQKPELLPSDFSKLKLIEGAQNNLPDENALKGAEAIKNLAEKLQEDDLLIVLISGGGSALLPLPKPTITLKDKQKVINDLMKSGADITELNCVRKNLSDIKGGGLARIAYPAKVVALILSDIVGDPLDFIASGPTTPDWNTFNNAWEIIEKYSISHKVPKSVRDILKSADIPINATALNSNRQFAHVDNFIVGNNRKAALGALQRAKSFGYQSFILSTKIQGDVQNLSKIYAELANLFYQYMKDPENHLKKDKLLEFLRSIKQDLGIDDSVTEEVNKLDLKTRKELCIISGGEPTVVVNQNGGKGGRNQELTLRFALEINKFNLETSEISFLSCGTDGIDGPTDAAGAFADKNLITDALKQGFNPLNFLANSDSYTFFSKFNNGKNLIKIGHTGTNVMDIHVMILRL